METVKGFSFMPKDTTGLFESMKYVEGDVLEQTWKMARRERLKQREQKIWEEFVQEQDIVSSVCEDDPYQFIEQLPEECVKELLEVELNKLKLEVKDEIRKQEEPEVKPEVKDHQCTVTFIDECEKEKDIYYIFEDKNGGDVSEPDEEMLNESTGSAPCTVRERTEEKVEAPPESRPGSSERASSKSSENVSSSLQNSIYCAKVKELRAKINGELVDIVTRLEKDVFDIDPEELSKLQKRSAEFCTRFSRVQLYHMQRQIQDMKRHSAGAPVTRHTHRQAQLARLVSLHQNLLHALQMLNKHMGMSGCCGEAGALVGSLARLVREAIDPALVPAPPAITLDNCDIEATCHKLEIALEEHSVKMMKFLNEVNNLVNSSGNTTKTNKLKNKKKLIGIWSKNNKFPPDAEARLSMYSLDMARKRSWYRPPTDKDSSPCVSYKSQERKNDSGDKQQPVKPSSPKATQKHNRPLRPCLPPTELHTMVEAVAPFASNTASYDGSPRGTSTVSVAQSPRHRSKHVTPRMAKMNDRKSLNNTPRSKASANANVKNSNKSNEPSRVSPRATGKKNAERVVDAGDPTKGPRGAEVASEVENKETPHSGRERDNKAASNTPDDVSRLLRELYANEVKSTARNEQHVSGPKNVQLLCVNSTTPPESRPSTPQMLRILEESIQNKSPKSIMVKSKLAAKDTEKYRMMMSLPENVAEKLFQYRTKFVQHMLTSSLYANNSVGKPWEMIGSVSEHIINELLLNCAKEMELYKVIQDLYKSEMS